MEAGGGQQRSSNWRPWAFGIVAVLALIFILQNSQKVEVEFLFFGSAQVALIFALLITFVLGFAAGWLFRRRKGE